MERGRGRKRECVRERERERQREREREREREDNGDQNTALVHQHLLWVLDKTLSPNSCYTHIVHYKEKKSTFYNSAYFVLQTRPCHYQ